MKTQAFIAFIALSACVTDTQDGFTGLVIPSADGVVALARNGQTIALAESDDNRLPLQGSLIDYPGGPLELSLQGLSYFSATVNIPSGVSLDASIPLTDIGYDTALESGVGFDDTVSFGLGPDGGSIRLTAIVPQDGGYRIRGEFSANVCPSDAADRDKPCFSLSGRFAFDEEGLPEGVDTGTLLQAGG